MKNKEKLQKKKETIVFIDGNNFYHNIKSMRIKPSTVNFIKLSKYVCSHFNCKHKKTIYYNSVPSLEDGEKLYYSHMKFLSEIRKLGIEVKTRKLQRHSTKEILQMEKENIESLDLCKTCKPLVLANSSDRIGDIKKREGYRYNDSYRYAYNNRDNSRCSPQRINKT